MNLLESLCLSKSRNIFLLFGKRDQFQLPVYHFLSLGLLKIMFSSFVSLRIFETRYFVSRLLILNNLRSMGLNSKNFSFSVSHSKYSFACLVMPKHINAAIDIEPLSRKLPDKFNKKINHLQEGIKLDSMKYLSLIETFIKLKATSWNKIKPPFLIGNPLDYNKSYITRINDRLIYSKFYNFNDMSVCISSEGFEI